MNTNGDYIVKVCCPVCGSRIGDRMHSCKLEVKQLHIVETTLWKPDLIEKCQRCKSTIGIRKQ